MKTTVEIPDPLLIAAKKHAAETRSTLKELIERGLRRELAEARRRDRGRPPKRRHIHWLTVEGGLPPGLDLSDRAAMHDFLRRGR